MAKVVTPNKTPRLKKLKPLKNCTGVLKLSLGRCRTAHTKRMLQDLDAMALDCLRARNASVRAWMRWSWDNPDYLPDPIFKKDGTILTRKGRPMVKNFPLPEKMEIPGHGEKSGTMLLYYAAGFAAPQVAAKIISSCASEVYDGLKTQTPYNHTGEAHYRWQAIRAYEVSPDSYHALEIPVPNQDAKLSWDDHGCVLSFPLFSKKAGRKNLSYAVNLEARQLESREGRQVGRPLSPGQKDILRRVTAGEWKMADSTLLKKNGRWFFHLTYTQPQLQLGLPKDRVAVLETLRADAGIPFAVSCGNDLWKLGHVAAFKAESQRVEHRRTVLKDRYKDSAASGVKGHGRGRFYARMKPRTRKFANHVNEFMNKIVAELVKFCVTKHCGTLHYREPSLNLRGMGWFAKNDLPMDWTGFLNRVRAKMHLHGIELIVEVESIAEWKARTKS